MSLIKAEKLTFAYPGSYDNIFENADFRIDTDWKLGFVGRNGRGKTTFLKLLMGEYEYSGRIISSVRFSYFPYNVEDKSLMAVEILAQICPCCEEWELHKELSRLDISTDALYRPFETLSNGEQTKMLLAALFLNDGHFLLIDEPTNHLDSAARKKVAKYLNSKKGFILVSHDRSFLDECVDHILSINKTDIEIQRGNFSSFYKGFTKRQEAETAQDARLQKDIKRLSGAAKRSSAWSDRVERSKTGAADKGYIGHKATKMMKRSKNIEKRQQLAIDKKQKLLKNAEYAESLKLLPLHYRSDTLATLNQVSVCYNGKEICAPVSFSVKGGDRIVLDGKNGSGKSSLLKLLAGAKPDHTGEITTGSGLIISYMPQDTSELKGSLTDFARRNNTDESVFKALLQKLGLGKIQFEKDMREFSEGQKKKVLIAKSLSERAHLYIWDEPLNYIDIYSRIQIEELINTYSPTIVFAEHDSAFRENIGAKVIKI